MRILRRSLSVLLIGTFCLPAPAYALRPEPDRAGVEEALRTATDPPAAGMEGVFSPDGSTLIFQELIQDHPDLFGSGKEALELGMGDGNLAFAMAQQGARVTAVDSLPAALETLERERTAQSAEVAGRVRAGISDLYAGLPEITGHEQNLFDVVVFNNPIFLRDPETPSDAARDAGKDGHVVRRALQGLLTHLKPDGDAFILAHIEINRVNGLWDWYRTIESVPEGWAVQPVHSSISTMPDRSMRLFGILRVGPKLNPRWVPPSGGFRVYLPPPEVPGKKVLTHRALLTERDRRLSARTGPAAGTEEVKGTNPLYYNPEEVARRLVTALSNLSSLETENFFDPKTGRILLTSPVAAALLDERPTASAFQRGLFKKVNWHLRVPEVLARKGVKKIAISTPAKVDRRPWPEERFARVIERARKKRFSFQHKKMVGPQSETPLGRELRRAWYQITGTNNFPQYKNSWAAFLGAHGIDPGKAYPDNPHKMRQAFEVYANLKRDAKGVPIPDRRKWIATLKINRLDSIWKDPRVQKAETLFLVGVPAYANQDRSVLFGHMGKPHAIGIPMEQFARDNPTRLILEIAVADPHHAIQTARRMDTVEIVYPVAGQKRILLDDGILYQSVYKLHPTLIRAALGAARRKITFENLATYPRDGTAAFRDPITLREHRTSIPYQPGILITAVAVKKAGRWKTARVRDAAISEKQPLNETERDQILVRKGTADVFGRVEAAERLFLAGKLHQAKGVSTELLRDLLFRYHAEVFDKIGGIPFFTLSNRAAKRYASQPTRYWETVYKTLQEAERLPPKEAALHLGKVAQSMAAAGAEETEPQRLRRIARRMQEQGWIESAGRFGKEWARAWYLASGNLQTAELFDEAADAALWESRLQSLSAFIGLLEQFFTVDPRESRIHVLNYTHFRGQTHYYARVRLETEDAPLTAFIEMNRRPDFPRLSVLIPQRGQFRIGRDADNSVVRPLIHLDIHDRTKTKWWSHRNMVPVWSSGERKPLDAFSRFQERLIGRIQELAQRDLAAAGMEEVVQALEKLFDPAPGSIGPEVLVFTEPETFDLVPLALRWGKKVAVLSDGPEAEALRELLESVPAQFPAGSYAVGIPPVSRFLENQDRQIWIENKEHGLRLLQLPPELEDLPEPVAQLLRATHRYLAIAASA